MTTKRNLPPTALHPFLNDLPDTVSKRNLGESVNGLPIQLLTLGEGSCKILMWSQMHGNESTTTRALLDFIPWFLSTAQRQYQKSFTLSIILQLNPDGAKAYTRLNAAGVDLNRDAIHLTQPESHILHNVYHEIKPDYCLNLHGQRTIFSAGKMGKTASLSFLAPSADPERSITPSRKKAMQLIVAIKRELEQELPGQIGRYDDAFNPNCVGDKFTQLGTPTILFEAGHVPNDYQREITRRHLFKCFKTLLNSILSTNSEHTTKEYFEIPENAKDFVDIIISGVTIEAEGSLHLNQEVAIRYKEQLEGGEVRYIPVMEEYGLKLPLNAHKRLVLPKNKVEKTLLFEKGETIQNKELNSFCSI